MAISSVPQPATPAEAAGGTSGDPAQALVAEQIRLLYQNTVIAQIVTLLNGALLAAIQSSALGVGPVLPWFALLAAVSLSRVALAYAYARAAPLQRRSPAWQHLYCIGAALAGLAWGASSFMLYAADSFVHQIFLLFVLSGMLAGAIGIMASWFPAFALFAAGTAMPAVVHSAMVGEDMHIAMAWLVFLFMMTMLVVARRVNRAIIEALQLRFENQQLVDHLIRQKDHAEALNRELLEAQSGLRKLNDELERRVEERTHDLKRANEDLERFAYAASHDLQEPVRTVANFAELLQQRHAGKLDADGREFLGYILNSALNMRRLIEDLLTYSRVDSDTTTGTPVDCEKLIEELQADLKSAISESGAVIEHDRIPPLQGHPGQIRQLFSNLLTNAIKFRGAAPPRIRIAARRQDRFCIISVQDNGIGIPQRYQSKIFEMFERLHGASRYPGTGMGLALCKRIVERHHGRIWVESNEGRGSTFFFSIPAADA